MNNQIQLVLKSSTTELSLNDHELGIYLVPELDGLTGLPEIRTTSGVNSGYDGGWTSAQHYDARSITIRGVIANTDVATVERLRKQLVSLAGQGKQEELTLDLVTEAGNAYTLQVRTIALEMAMKGVLEKQEFMLQLRADDPLIYDNAESTHDAYIQVSKATGGFTIDFNLPLAITGGSEETVISNDGLEQVPTITRLYGELHNPKIINQTTNQSMQINANLGFSEGQWVDASEVVTGKAINIEDAPDNAPLASFRLDGETSQNGTPTPSAPVAVKTVTGENVVKICGKNLFDISEVVKGRIDNGVIGYESNTTSLTLGNTSFTFTVNAAWRGCASGVILVEPNTTYHFKATASSAMGGSYVDYYNSDGWVSRYQAPGAVLDYTFTTPNNCSYVRLSWQVAQIGTFTISSPQLELGSATAYEPYRGQSYEVNLSLLPAEYQEVEYIESSAVAGQAINLKYYSTANTRFEIDYMRKSSMISAPVFGARHDSTASDTRKLVLWTKDTTSGEAINFGSVDSGYVAGTTSGVRHITSNIGANLYYNGTQVYANDTAVKITDDLPLYMFAMNSNGNADVRTNAIKLYSFKLYEGTTLTADLVPCYRVADNVIGLYDLVRQEFYQAIGASTLSKGPNAANRAIELCGLGDDGAGGYLYKNGIYKNLTNNKWYVHKEAGVLAVNTSTITSSGTSYSNVIYGQVLKNDDAINKGGYTHYVGLCSHAIWSGNPSNWNSADNAGRCYDGANSTRYWIGFASGTSLDDIKTALSGCKIVYPLATPTDTEITNEALIAQLETLLNTARTYAGVNNIFTVTPNEQGTLEISYYTHKTADNRDEIVIDSRLRTVTLNGLDIYHLIETGSEFLMLAPGENKLSLQSDITGDNGYAEVSYKQGYLSI